MNTIKYVLSEKEELLIGKPADFSFKKFTELKAIGIEGARLSRIGHLPSKSYNQKFLTRALWLNNNKLHNILNVESLLESVLEEPSKLGWVDFSYNYIKTIDAVILKYTDLKIVYFHGNLIENFDEIIKLKELKELRSVTFHGNPIAEHPSYRAVVICLLPQIFDKLFDHKMRLVRKEVRDEHRHREVRKEPVDFHLNDATALETGKPIDYSFKNYTILSAIGIEAARVSRVGQLPLKASPSQKFLTRAVWLNNNKLKSIDNLDAFVNSILVEPSELSWIDLSFNYIESIGDVLLQYHNLKIAYFHGNKISSFEDVLKLRQLKSLRSVTFHGNPIADEPKYRAMTIALLPQVVNIDFAPVIKSERLKPSPSEALKRLAAYFGEEEQAKLANEPKENLKQDETNSKCEEIPVVETCEEIKEE